MGRTAYRCGREGCSYTNEAGFTDRPARKRQTAGKGGACTVYIGLGTVLLVILIILLLIYVF
jgi:hypothetical protein